jgi:hypothetical protein
MSGREATAPPAPARSLNLLEASADDLSAMLIARLVTTNRGGCGTFSCGTFGRVRQAQEAETAANT